MNSRSEFIRDFGSTNGAGLAHVLFNAFVQCLSTEEACAALDLSFQQEFAQRRTILRKILNDCIEGFRECHRDLVTSLIDRVETLPALKRQSCGHCLSYLCEGLPDGVRDDVIRFLLSSPYVGFRRRGYKELRKRWDSTYEDLISGTWATYRDNECAQLIVEHFPEDYLQDHFDSLDRELVHPWSRARLYIRTAPTNPNLLMRISDTDEITHAYVLTKLGQALTFDEAIGVYYRCRDDERLGLLLWCYGRMGLWDALEHIDQELFTDSQ